MKELLASFVPTRAATDVCCDKWSFMPKAIEMLERVDMDIRFRISVVDALFRQKDYAVLQHLFAKVMRI